MAVRPTNFPRKDVDKHHPYKQQSHPLNGAGKMWDSRYRRAVARMLAAASAILAVAVPAG